MPTFDLLSKTEMRIENIVLEKANLTDIAARVADVLGLQRSEVLVVDYRDEAMTLDILNTCVNAHNVLGMKDRLLGSLGDLPGVRVSEETSIQSDGMLGWIAIDEPTAREALFKSEQMAAEILRNISKRVIVFSTGSEVADGQIEDTNTPAIMECLAEKGYKVTSGGTLRDDEVCISAKLREAADREGYGVIVTTGGVGAEDKDHTVESVRALDSDAATPYICHFEIGTGRHVKDGIRIAVGRYNGSLIVALPGPNDEVKASLDVLVEGLETGMDEKTLAETIAAALRGILREKMVRHGPHH
ncbi:MAG: molybdopterin-binding protein [Desulfomonilaceae bacterium]|nr:molybdopterin-binding protein [Desulfomonilaceae bacterium]